MNKKGFTLIELLAVIVILAIISLIAVPIILNVIETTRVSSNESSMTGYVDAIEKQIISAQIKGGTAIGEGTYSAVALNNLGVTIKGEKPDDTSVFIINNKGYVTEAWATYKGGKYKVYYNGTKAVADTENYKDENGVTHNNVAMALPMGYTVISGDLNTNGSIVKIANEEFYVLGQEDESHVRLISKYNLNVGDYQYKENNVVIGPGLQNEHTIGRSYLGDASPFTGSVKFSTTPYWSNQSTEIGAAIYDERNNIVKNYVDNYVAYLRNYGVNVTGRILLWSDLLDVGCEYSECCGGYYCINTINTNNYDWLFMGCSWTGFGEDNYVQAIYFSGGVAGFSYDDNENCGVRPVIILEK